MNCLYTHSQPHNVGRVSLASKLRLIRLA